MRIQSFRLKAAENGAKYIFSVELQAHYPPEKGFQYPMDWRLCGPQGYSGRCGEEKKLPFLGNDPQFFSHLSHSQ
jgi:hypothetical protein